MEQQRFQPQKKDDMLSGFLIMAGILVLIIGFIYLLSVQQKKADCAPLYNPDGTVQTGCSSASVIVTPPPDTSVDLLDQLNKDQISDVDKRLQEAAQDLRNRQNAQQQQSQQRQIPTLPQQ